MLISIFPHCPEYSLFGVLDMLLERIEKCSLYVADDIIFLVGSRGAFMVHFLFA